MRQTEDSSVLRCLLLYRLVLLAQFLLFVLVVYPFIALGLASQKTDFSLEPAILLSCRHSPSFPMKTCSKLSHNLPSCYQS